MLLLCHHRTEPRQRFAQVRRCARLNLKDLSYRVVVVALFVTVVLLWAGSAAYQYATVDRPLAVLLGGHAEVAGYDLLRARGAPVRVEVKLQDVQHLQRTYDDLTEGLQAILGRHNLVIVDTRTPDLVEFFAQAQYALQEAAQNGNFVAMEKHLSLLAATHGVDLRLGVGRERLFVQVASEHGQLYEVVSRVGSGGVSRQ